ncbi:MAG: hypothetical protein WCV90_08700 [Candidatus Woesearchaeota archaeon]
MADDLRTEEKKQNPLLKDLIIATPLSLLLGTIVGGIESLVHPFGVINSVKEIRGEGINEIHQIAGYSSEFIVYGYCWYKYIEEMVQHPYDAVSYIPLGLNLLSVVAQTAYKTYKGNNK